MYSRYIELISSQNNIDPTSSINPYWSIKFWKAMNLTVSIKNRILWHNHFVNRSKTNRFQVYGQQCLWLTLYIFQDTIYIKTWFYHPPLGSTPDLLGHEGSSETSILEGDTLRLQCKGSYPLSWTYYQGIDHSKVFISSTLTPIPGN